jgi:hypothetical protein
VDVRPEEKPSAVLTIVTWIWGDKFNTADVAKLAAGVRRHLKQPHRFLCMVDRLEGREPIEGVGYRLIVNSGDLLKVKGCFARLRIFDPQWQFLREIAPDDIIVNIDLDTVITGLLDPLFDRPEPFVIMQDGNAHNPCPFNGSMQMLRAGYRPDVWTDFSLEAAAKTKFYEFPDDQGWLWDRIPDAAGWKCGDSSGVYVFRKPGWPGWDSKNPAQFDNDLPAGARLVTFSGWRSPEKFQNIGWVKDHWI